MARPVYIVVILILLAGLPLVYGTAWQTAVTGIEGADCAGPTNGMGCMVAFMGITAFGPVLAYVVAIGLGIVALLRARRAALSPLWGFLVFVLAAQASLIAVQFVVMPAPDANPLQYATSFAELWLLASLLLALAILPEWRGPLLIEIGLGLIAGLAAIASIGLGASMSMGPLLFLRDMQAITHNVLAPLPNAAWIALGVFGAAMAGIFAGRLLPEAD